MLNEITYIKYILNMYILGVVVIIICTRSPCTSQHGLKNLLVKPYFLLNDDSFFFLNDSFVEV